MLLSLTPARTMMVKQPRIPLLSGSSSKLKIRIDLAVGVVHRLQFSILQGRSRAVEALAFF